MKTRLVSLYHSLEALTLREREAMNERNGVRAFMPRYWDQNTNSHRLASAVSRVPLVREISEGDEESIVIGETPIRWVRSREAGIPVSGWWVQSHLVEVRRYPDEDSVRSWVPRHVAVWSSMYDDFILRAESTLDGCGRFFLAGDDDYVQTDSGDWHHRTDCHFCDVADDWVYGDEDECECSSPRESSSHINEYDKLPPFILYKGRSGWLVGFEVEKNSVNGATEVGDYVGETPLFAGWTTDGSCGVEGGTHVYDPIDPRTKELFQLHLRRSRSLVDEKECNSDCGGHINVSHKEYLPGTLFLRFRRHCAHLMYAMYPTRLRSGYAGRHNKWMDINDQHKYSPVYCHSNRLELRLPNRVADSDVLLNRFEMMELYCQAMEYSWSSGYLLRKAYPLLSRCYGDAKLRRRYRMALLFREWLDSPTGDVEPFRDTEIGQYIR